MAKFLADNLQLFVASDDAGADLIKPLGQGNLTINRNDSSIDLSDKTTGRYGTSAPGQSTLTLTQAIQPNLPDPGFARLKAVDAARTPTKFQVRDITGANGGSVMFECVMYCGFGNSEAPQKGVAATTVTLYAADAPTVDMI